MPKKKICTKHDEIYDLCDELKDLDFNKSVKKKVLSIANKIQKLVNSAKNDGQNMEDRLMEYYHTINSLGFKRSKSENI